MEKSPRIVYLEDDSNSGELIRRALLENVPDPTIDIVASRESYLSALRNGDVDVILSDSQVPGFDGMSALEIAREGWPDVPFICVSSYMDSSDVDRLKAAGATAYVSKTQLSQLVSTVQDALQQRRQVSNQARPDFASAATARLVAAVQELSMARDLATIMNIVRRAARELTGADGATFVLREGDLCHYAEENAIAPLWKGRRFPMHTCISGWAMLNGQAAIIEDIYADERIPIDAYRPTFVKSLAMVPIRPAAPIGAIGNYWAHQHHATSDEVKLLQALANSTSIALENVQLYAELEQRVSDRTAQLEMVNKELEAFSFAVSHDLRAPLRHIHGFSEILAKEWSSQLDEEGRDYLRRLTRAAQHMEELIDDLLTLSRMTQAPARREKVNLGAMAAELIAEMQLLDPERKVDFIAADNVHAIGDPGLLNVVLQNLLSNAWKFTTKRDPALIEFGRAEDPNNGDYYFVRDNGLGFDMAYAGKLFTPFQRLHSNEEVPGTGVGLATVQRIVHRHGGRIWAEAVPGEGATFFFTLGE